MSELGFYLRRLRITGKKVKEADVEFFKGFNLVSGPSDTGKSYILQCLDFALGAKRLPKEIPEASGYDTVTLEIVGADGESTLLRRALAGGDFVCTRNGEEFELKAQHSKSNTNTVSYLLLSLSGLENKRVRTNKEGKTNSLSFRNVSRFCVINEDQVKAEQSPVISGQYTTKTSEESVFRLLLSGMDDSTVSAIVKKKNVIAGRRAKEELVAELIESTQSQIAALGSEDTFDELTAQLDRATTFLDGVNVELDQSKTNVDELEEERQSLWNSIRNAESRLQVVNELVSRFELLELQYKSDLRRLAAIREAGSLLQEFGDERCPVCGALKKDHSLDSVEVGPSPSDVSVACAAESSKVEVLLADLQETQGQMLREKEDLEGTIKSGTQRVGAIISAIESQLRPQLGGLIVDYQQACSARESVIQSISLHERLRELESLSNELTVDTEDESDQQEYAQTSASDLDEFAIACEERLKNWNFPHVDRVTFSESDLDLVISGRRRTSFGQGKRAVTFAAFSLGLLDYCTSRQLPHPGFVVIDSPLLVYREPDKEERDFTPEVKQSFFADLISNFTDSQIIILDHEELPDEFVGSDNVNWIKFTGADIGRQGFIPQR